MAGYSSKIKRKKKRQAVINEQIFLVDHEWVPYWQDIEFARQCRRMWH